MQKIAVVLSGCGVQDGSEIHEAVLTLLAIAKTGADYECLAPDLDQHHVVDHLTGEAVSGAVRNVLQESARIARGHIKDIAQANPADYAAVIFPGGFGAAQNLCNFAQAGAEHTVQPAVLKFVQEMAKQGKPAGFLCIAPVMISKIYGAGLMQTIGHDKDTARAIAAMGGVHRDCSVDDIIIDVPHKVVTSPAYMLASSIVEVQASVEKLVRAVVELMK